MATRNILVHAYAQLDQRRVWEILTGDLPELIPPPAAPYPGASPWGRTQHRRWREVLESLGNSGIGGLSRCRGGPGFVAAAIAREWSALLPRDDVGGKTQLIGPPEP
ncbi:HepT-like ribonuclease domain-containing protein [Leifsonia sp. NPDC056665]|uniref:HepT-like ribonuclease domain-containing protein n=1 Tax=Leifsonia sp. NPDC056665 TaxID=3345901 RepID=UPI0036A3CEB5